MTVISVKSFWHTIGQRATGMTVVTADGDDGPGGFLGLSASHVTADPPTMLVSIDQKTGALASVLDRKHFAVNFLPATAGHVADMFGGKAGVHGTARFADGEWTTLTTGAPVYREALGVFDCVVTNRIGLGNISIVIGTVVATAAREDGDPLIYYRGKTYCSLGAAR